MSERRRQPALSGAAVILISTLLGATSVPAQGTQDELPQTMRVPPLRGETTPTGVTDGRVGDPLPPALTLVPESDATKSQDAPAALETPHDGAVGDLLKAVPNVPPSRPSETEIDGKVGDLLPTTPNVPSQRPGDAVAVDSSRPVPVAMNAEEKQCRARLADLGATFREIERLGEPSGCMVPFPVVLTGLGSGIGLEPEAVLNCQAALALVDYAQTIVAPEALKRFDASLATVNHASAYVCRERVGVAETKMSEHAYGNAIDIAAFALAGGRSVEVRAYGPGERTERDFMRKVRGAACGLWKTVLGPGTNAEHATHLHLDLAQRRRGGTYCK